MEALLLFSAFNGLIVGIFYAMMALGLSLILGLNSVINFAHGGFMVLGGYFAFTFEPVLGFWGCLGGGPGGDEDLLAALDNPSDLEHADLALAYGDILDPEAFDRGLLLETSGPYDSVVKLMPPLTTTEAELDAGLDILAASIREARDAPERTTQDTKGKERQ